MTVINSIADLREIARRRIPRAIFDYADRGSYDEITFNRNLSDLAAIQLRQRPGDVAGPVREGTPIGSPDTVIRALKQWEAIGVDRMVFLINYDQVIPHEKVMNSLRLFAEQVMPAFKEPEKPSLTTTPALDLMKQPATV